MKSDEIRQFWAEQARLHGESPSASWSDHRVIELEIDAISAHLRPGDRVLDAGCANGYSSACYAALGAQVVGVDYIPEMVENAESRRQALPQEVAGRLEFRVGDIQSLDFEDASFDAVVSTRVIINLPSWDEQLGALRDCVRVLRPGGLFLLSEATEQGWRRLNALRREWGLTDIPMPSFNLYLDQSLVLEAVAGELEVEEISDFASSYYVATRLLKPLLAARAEVTVDVADPNGEFNRLGGAAATGRRLRDPEALRPQTSLGLVVHLFVHGVRRPVHDAHVHARDVLPDDAEREQLRAGEDRDHRGKEGKPRNRVAHDEVVDEDEHEDGEAQERKGDSDQRRDPQRPCGKAGQDVERVRREPHEAVVRRARGTSVVSHRDGGEA